MENTVAEGHVHEERRDGADSPDSDTKSEGSGEAKAQLLSAVQVHAPAEGESSSSDYLEVRDGDRHSSSSSSSSDDEDEGKEGAAEPKVEEVTVEPAVESAVEPKVEPAVQPEVTVEPKVQVTVEPSVEPTVEPEVEVTMEPEVAVTVVEQVNGEAHDSSRRSSASSSASSASSASPGDPCEDPPIQPKTEEKDTAEDGMLMAHTHPDTDAKPEESGDYSLKTLESVSLDESSAAPAEPDQPDIALFVKVRTRHGSAEHGEAWWPGSNFCKCPWETSRAGSVSSGGHEQNNTCIYIALFKNKITKCFTIKQHFKNQNIFFT